MLLSQLVFVHGHPFTPTTSIPSAQYTVQKTTTKYLSWILVHCHPLNPTTSIPSAQYSAEDHNHVPTLNFVSPVTACLGNATALGSPTRVWRENDSRDLWRSREVDASFYYLQKTRVHRHSRNHNWLPYPSQIPTSKHEKTGIIMRVGSERWVRGMSIAEDRTMRKESLIFFSGRGPSQTMVLLLRRLVPWCQAPPCNERINLRATQK